MFSQFRQINVLYEEVRSVTPRSIYAHTHTHTHTKKITRPFQDKRRITQNVPNFKEIVQYVKKKISRNYAKFV